MNTPFKLTILTGLVQRKVVLHPDPCSIGIIGSLYADSLSTLSGSRCQRGWAMIFLRLFCSKVLLHNYNSERMP